MMYATIREIEALNLEEASEEVLDAMLDACEYALRHHDGRILRQDLDRIRSLMSPQPATRIQQAVAIIGDERAVVRRRRTRSALPH